MLCVFEFLFHIIRVRDRKSKIKIWAPKFRKQAKHDFINQQRQLKQTLFHSTTWWKFKTLQVLSGSPDLPSPQLISQLECQGDWFSESTSDAFNFQLGAIWFPCLKIFSPILGRTTKSKSAVWALPATSPAILRKLPRVKGCLRSSLPARGRDADFNPAIAFKQSITWEMPVQSRSILIMCQACRLFLKASGDKQKTKDSKRKLGEASIKNWEHEEWALGKCLAVNDDGVVGRTHEVGVLSGWVFNGPASREQWWLQEVNQGLGKINAKMKSWSKLLHISVTYNPLCILENHYRLELEGGLQIIQFPDTLYR